MELFSLPAVGGIIERTIEGIDYILIQQRDKEDAKTELGMLEIPAGKIREFENIFDCLRREVREETGLDVSYIEGEDESIVYESNGYKVLNYAPFSCSQNTCGTYPIMVQVFICKANGILKLVSNESKNIRWIALKDLRILLEKNLESLYPMHVETLKKYLNYKMEAT